jgi:hypothetical protein
VAHDNDAILFEDRFRRLNRRFLSFPPPNTATRLSAIILGLPTNDVWLHKNVVDWLLLKLGHPYALEVHESMFANNPTSVSLQSPIHDEICRINAEGLG